MTQPRQLLHVDPIRRPQRLDATHRDIRGWLLLVASALLPGSVQTVFGARRSRLPLLISITVWVCVFAAIALVLIRSQSAFTLATNPFILTFVLALLIVAGISWVLCMLDTVRRVRLHTLSQRARPRFLAAACVAVLVVTGGTAYGAVMVNSQRALMTELFAAGWGERPTDGRYNILLLGSDAGDGREGIRPDSITVVSVDAKTGGAVMIGLPRNMQNVPFPEDTPLASVHPTGFDCGDECILNAVYQEGEKHAEAFDDDEPAGVQAMKDAAAGITGLDVQYYAMIDLKGFETLIDAMGGITLQSEKRVPISSAIDPSTGRHGPVKGWIEPGEQHLDGYHALWYARSREFASDYERMIRQRCVQDAMVRQLDPSTLLLRFQDIAQAAPTVVSTDIPQIQVDTFVDLALKTRTAGTTSLNLTPPDVNPTRPDFTHVRALVSTAVDESEAAVKEKASTQAEAIALWAAPALVAAQAEPTEDESEPAAEAICSVP